MEAIDSIVQTPASTRGRILFADDNEPFRLGVAKWLTKNGYACDVVGTGAEAIERLRTVDYDVLLTDINMPGNAGLELIESLPSVIAGLPVILLTGNPTVETASRSVRLRVLAYLTKPPAFDELLQLIKFAVGERWNARMLQASRVRIQNWDREVERLQQLLQQPAGADRQTAMQSYLRLTLRNLVVGLVELENLLVQDGERLGTDELMEKQGLQQAVRKTIAVLQRTKDHFKSKELGELRRELEALID
jgi:CheY-like chemotaxis protein